MLAGVRNPEVRMLNGMKGWLAKINIKIFLMVTLGIVVAGGAVVLVFSQYNRKSPVENLI